MDTSRRDFLMTAGGIAIAGGVLGSTLSAQAADAPAAAVEHKLPELPYAYDALEPYIDAQTMTLHHDKHHAGYVKNLNAAEAALEKARAANDFALVQHWSKQVAFNGAGVSLHNLFWTIMAPNGKGGGGQPAGKLLEKITQDFGSFDAFKAQFSAAAASVEAAGWAALHYRKEDGRLLVLQIENHQKLTPWGVTPLLVLDVWEHAYYLKYQNKRPDYITAWWNVVNWEQVQANLEAAAK